MGTSLTQPGQVTHAIEPRQRLERLGGLTPEQLTAALTWLSGYDPDVFDTVLNAVEPCAGDPVPDGSDEPEPFCGCCGSAIGIFLRFGLDWQHYRQDRGDSTAFGRIELFDPGHAPTVACRLAQGDAPL